MRNKVRGAAGAGLLALLAWAAIGCGAGQGSPTGVPSSSPAAASMPTSTPATPSPPATAVGTPVGGAGQVVGTVVRFSAGSASVEVTIDRDSPAVRDFLTLLPLALTLEEFAGKEKIGYLPRRLAHGSSPGSDPEDGDLIYYVPWGNLGFYYDAGGVGYSDQTIHIGKYNATREQLGRLEGQAVTVEIVRR